MRNVRIALVSAAMLAVALPPTLGLPTQAAAESPPVIDSVYPDAGQAGSRATISGRGFGPQNALIVDGKVVGQVSMSGAIGIACTAAPDCKSGIKQNIDFAIPANLLLGPHAIRVKTGGSTSNSVRFVVTP